MSDALSLGSRAFEELFCESGEPSGCAKKGGQIIYENGKSECAFCGLTTKFDFDTSPTFNNDKMEKRFSLSETGAKRGKKRAFNKLFGDSTYVAAHEDFSGGYKVTDIGLVKKFKLSANAAAETERVFYEMLEKNYQLGGKGLDAVVYAAAFHGCQFDYNFVPIEKIVRDSSSIKKANSLIKRARQDGIIKLVQKDPVAILESALSKHASSNSVQELAIKFAKIYIPNLRPDIHASGALYKSMKITGNSSEKRISQEEIGKRFHVSRKHVGQGYRAINEALTPKSNPGHLPNIGITGEQLKLLRALR